MQPIHADVVVAGAGPAGATITRLLARMGRQVALVDPNQHAIDRLEVLSPSAMAVVHALQLDDVLSDPNIARPCAGIRRKWTSREVEFDDFLARPGSRGVVVDRAKFDFRLRALAEAAGATLIVGRMLGASISHGSFDLKIGHSGEATRFSAPVVVDATGRASALACRLGAKRIVKERLVAGRLRVERSGLSSQGATWLDVEAHQGFWTYATLGPDGRRESWSIRPRGQQRSAREDLVNASVVYLSPAAGKGWLAIGDAATAFDPITSQGLVNALSSALIGAGVVADEGGLSARVASDYTAVVQATFAHSERGRAEVYRAMAIGQQEQSRATPLVS